MAVGDERPTDIAADAGDMRPYAPHTEETLQEPESDAEASERGPDEHWRFWNEQITAALKHENRFRSEGHKVEQLYFGEAPDVFGQDNREDATRCKIGDDTALIHGTVDVLKPLLYSDTPQPVARRRFRGDGEASDTETYAAEAAQRIAQFLVSTEEFDAAMEAARDDWLLPGRGWARVFYSAEFAPGLDGVEQKVNERVSVGACDWIRFLCAPADGWRTVPWVAFESLMTRTQIERRFDNPEAEDGPISKRIAYNRKALTDRTAKHSPDDADGGFRAEQQVAETHATTNSPFDTATVWEIWDRERKQVIWWSPDFHEGILDREDDPMQLEGFFPGPKPLLANTVRQRLTPRSDIRYYEQRAKEAETAAKKLRDILKTISISGLVPGSMQGEIQKILKGDNVIVAISDWISLMEKGGTRDVIQWLPLDQMIAAMQALLTMREAAKGAMFEASGVSDIMRAQGDPTETATAQQLKGRYAGMRLSERQRAMAIFARDTIRLMVETAVTFFDTATIADICGLGIPTTEAERQAELMRREQIMAEHAKMVELAQMFEAAGMQPPPPPPPPQFEHMADTSVELVHATLRNDLQRKITVNIETQSTILADEQADKEARVEFLQSFSGMVQQLLPMAMSGQLDFKLLKELLMFGVRGFPKARTLETMIEDLPDEPQGEPAKDPSVQVAEIRAEVDRMLKEMDMANDEADRQNDVRLKEMDLQERAAETGFKAGVDASREAAQPTTPAAPET